jgi:transcriptional regulator with XRE-family HTH domain
LNTLSSTLYNRFLARLKDARLKAGMTQGDVAKKIHRPQSFVSKYEKGERRLDIAEFIQICKVVGIPAHKLVKELSD